MKSFLRGLLITAAGFVFGAMIAVGVTAPLSLLTGPAGTNPVIFPSDLPDLNNLINNLNTAISPTGLYSASTFQLQGQTSVGSLTMGLIQPPTPLALKSTTMKGWIVFTDSQNNQSYIPFWQ